MTARVAVAFCTYHRPALVGPLLDAIARCAREDLPGELVPIVVVDDSPGATARTVVEAHARGDSSIHYLQTGSGDISTARNVAVTTASTLAEFVVCLDDDCLPEPHWLAALLEAAARWDAHIVAGHHRFVAAPDALPWMHREPFLLEHAEYEEGCVPPIGNMANVLMRSEWLIASGVRFHPEFGGVGGEDMVFFADATASGARIRYTARSVVLEAVGGTRATFRYQLWRQHWLGNNEAHINLSTGAAGPLRLAARGARRVLRGLMWPVQSRRRNGVAQWHWALGQIASGAGLMTGVLGARVAHR